MLCSCFDLFGGQYPRDLGGDVHKLSGLADCVFAPSNLYSPVHCVDVVPASFSSGEGIMRPTHFRGVATVVTKLFNIVQPSKAFFGQKDGQQCIVVRSLVRDLDMPLEIVVCPTSRALDGLALSSRNAYLTPEQRAIAPILYKALSAAAKTFVSGVSTVESLRVAFDEIIARAGDSVRTQYFSCCSNDTGVESSPGVVLNGPLMIAAAIGFPGASVRLLDNIVV